MKKYVIMRCLLNYDIKKGNNIIYYCMMNELLILLILTVSCSAYTLETSQIFCMSQSASIVAINETAEEQDNVVELVPVEAGDRIELQCQVCSDENTQKLTDEVSPRLWYRRDVQEQKLWEEVQLGMDAHLTENHVYMTAQHTLVIQNFQLSQDVGRYECRGLEGDDLTNTIVYLLDELLPLNATEPYESGNMSLWTYFKSELEPLGAVLDDIAGDDSPDVAMHWSSWGPCEDCEKGFGERWKRGRCRIIAPAILNLLPYNLTTISCRSSLISELNITKSVHDQFLAVPDFILYEPCECVHEGFTATESYLELKHNLQEGDNLNLMCPGASGHEIVEWKKGMEILSSGVWMKHGSKGRMRVDALGTLHIEHAEPPAAGHYSCHAAKRTWHFLVAVEQQFVLASEEFKHHQIYLIATLGICFLFYLIYLLLLCCEAPDVRHKIIFGNKHSSAVSNPYSDDEYCNLHDKKEGSELELNVMESGSQVSGVSVSVVEEDGNINPYPRESPRHCSRNSEQVLDIPSEAEQSDPTRALLQ